MSVQAERELVNAVLTVLGRVLRCTPVMSDNPEAAGVNLAGMWHSPRVNLAAPPLPRHYLVDERSGPCCTPS